MGNNGVNRVGLLGAAIASALAHGGRGQPVELPAPGRIVNDRHKVTAESEAGRRMVTARFGNKHHNKPSFNGAREIARRKKQMERNG